MFYPCLVGNFCFLTYILIAYFSRFLTKLLTEDLPRLFVRPKKIVLDFQKGKAVGPDANDLKSGDEEGNDDLKSGEQEGNKDYVGELSVTIVDARKLSYVLYGKNFISLSKDDSQEKTSVIYELVKFQALLYHW